MGANKATRRDFPFVADADGGLEAEFAADPGLWQVTLVARGTAEQWERLYFPLFRYGNKGQRTGPWDFSLDPERLGTPLLPAFEVRVNAGLLGLWFFQRPPIGDIDARIFRGRFAFHLADSGKARVVLTPYRPQWTEGLEWIGGWIEPDPEDEWAEDAAVPRVPLAAPPAQAWTDEDFWERARRSLRGGLRRFAKPLQAAFDGVRGDLEDTPRRGPDGRVISKDVAGPEDLRLLYAAWKLDRGEEWKRILAHRTRKYLAPEDWSAKADDVYGHGGDYAIGHPFRVLAQLLPGLREVLEPKEHRRLRETLRFVGGRFFNRALLMRDYWGGSVLQDHGWKSTFAFTAGALALLPEDESARLWLRWALPRSARARAAAPRDGVIPPSSYRHLWLYTNELMHLRGELLAWTGEDILREPPWHRVTDYLAVLHSAAPPATGGGGGGWNPDRMAGRLEQLAGGNAFLSALAEIFSDPVAQALEDKLLANPSRAKKSRRYGSGIMDALLVRTGRRVRGALPDAPSPLHWFRDSGWVYCRHPDSGLRFTLESGPGAGYHAFAAAPGPCDRVAHAPTAGHFQLAWGERPPLFATPDSRYKLHSGTGSILFIGGHGQIRDVGYPMSIPSCNGPWGEVRSVHWDAARRLARVVMDLSAMYPAACGLLHYTRTFELTPEPGIFSVTDRLALQQPQTLAWRFQIDPAATARIRAGKVHLQQDGACFSLRADGKNGTGPWSEAPTEAVFGYTSAALRYRHLAIATRNPVPGGLFRFTLSPAHDSLDY